MKFIPTYKTKLNCNNSEEVFLYLLDTLKPTIKSWDYFVNWEKVLTNYRKHEDEFNLMNSLIGKENIEQEALRLFSKYPETKKVIPLLLACREKELMLLTNYKGGFQYKNFVFNTSLSAEDTVAFVGKSGLLKLFQDKDIKSVGDYIIGVEAGLDSNARKNRSGISMENIVEYYISTLCSKNNWEWVAQATKSKVKKLWNKDITVEKSIRRIDFAILANEKLYLIETNFYGGGGSKIKSTAGEYKSDFSRWTDDGHEFIWITDGFGWKSTHKPLNETFDDTDYILNLDMLEKDILEDILNT